MSVIIHYNCISFIYCIKMHKLAIEYPFLVSIHIYLPMNALHKQLSQNQTLQSFLLSMIKLCSTQLSSTTFSTESKTYIILTKLFDRISNLFPRLYAIQTIHKRIQSNLKQNMEERTTNSHPLKKKKLHTLKNFMEQIAVFQTPSSTQQLQLDQSNVMLWLKKMVMSEFGFMSEDIKQSEQLLTKVLKSRLINMKVYFYDSYLNNKVVVRQLKNVESVVLESASSQLKNAEGLLISCDCVLKTGGVLAASGALMLAIICQCYGVPVWAISRDYCISDEIIVSNHALLQNPLKYFNKDQRDFKVYIGKDYDYIDPMYITQIVTERGFWNPGQVIEMYEQYLS